MTSKKANFDSYNIQNQFFILENRTTLLLTTLQLVVVIFLVLAITITNLDFSNYPNYIYFVFIGYQSFKKKNSIWVILKKSKSWRETKERSILDIIGKKYICHYYKSTNKFSAVINKFG